MSAAGLGLQLYDAVLGTSVNDSFRDWMRYAQQHYMGRDRKGRIDWVAFYYDPIEDVTMTFPGTVNAYSSLILLHYLSPQDHQLGIDLYESSMRQLAWSNPKVPVVQLADDPQLLSTALWMARDLGDSTTWDRLREVAEREFEPRFFGADDSRFAFWFHETTQWPRGQLNATMMMIECAEPGAWTRVFNSPNLVIHQEPTIHGVDYPNIGVRRTHHDPDLGTLAIDTYAATPSRRGTATSFTVDRLPVLDRLSLHVDGQASQAWQRQSETSISVDVTVDSHHLTVTYR